MPHVERRALFVRNLVSGLLLLHAARVMNYQRPRGRHSCLYWTLLDNCFYQQYRQLLASVGTVQMSKRLSEAVVQGSCKVI